MYVTDAILDSLPKACKRNKTIQSKGDGSGDRKSLELKLLYIPPEGRDAWIS